MSRLRVSAISFLNTAPLMWEFDHGSLRQRYQVDYTLPSSCAELLRQGMADIGIIPVAAYASIPHLVVIPDIAIAAKGPVRSILLVSKVPIESIRTVAADTSSRSSVALLKVLFAKFYRADGSVPEFMPLEPKLKTMLAACDAALVIGDPALLAKTDGYEVRDLATEWRALTGKAFVFAFWAVRSSAASAEVVSDFRRSRDLGLIPANLDKTAREWAVRLGLPEKDIRSYLKDNIFYYLDEDCLSGLKLFYEYAAGIGAIPNVPAVKFIQV